MRMLWALSMAVAGCSLVADLDGLIPDASVQADGSPDAGPDAQPETSTDASTDGESPDVSIADGGTDALDANTPDARFCDLHQGARYCNDFEGATDSLLGFDEAAVNIFAVETAEKSNVRAAQGVASLRMRTTTLTGAIDPAYFRKRVNLGTIPTRLEISYALWTDQAIDGNAVDQFKLQTFGVNTPYGATSPSMFTSISYTAVFADGGSQKSTAVWTRAPAPTGKWFPVRYVYKRAPDTLEWTIDSTSAITGTLAVPGGDPLRFNTLVLDVGYFTFGNKKPQREIFVDNILVETF